MKTINEYKANLINEINEYKSLLIQMGFDWPLEELNNDIPLETIEEFYAEIMGFIELHNYRAKNYPHTSGR